MSLSLHAGATVEEIMRAGHDPDRLLIVEVNPRLPRTLGLPPELPHAIPAVLADAIIESDREPFVLADPEPTATEEAIARHVATFVRDGATLQTGIGGVPSMVARLLAEGPGGDYGVHSEMFTTGLMHLHRAGKVSNLTHLDGGTLVTTPRYHVDVVVTEYGSAELLGKTVYERALARAEIAHPDFRDDLRESTTRLGLGATAAPT